MIDKATIEAEYNKLASTPGIDNGEGGIEIETAMETLAWVLGYTSGSPSESYMEE